MTNFTLDNKVIWLFEKYSSNSTHKFRPLWNYIKKVTFEWLNYIEISFLLFGVAYIKYGLTSDNPTIYVQTKNWNAVTFILVAKANLQRRMKLNSASDVKDSLLLITKVGSQLLQPVVVQAVIRFDF